jgi:hypothetical protein
MMPVVASRLASTTPLHKQRCCNAGSMLPTKPCALGVHGRAAVRKRYT